MQEPAGHLVEGLRQGSEDAWRELVRGLTTPLFHYARSIAGDGDLAQEAVQTAFIRLYKARRHLCASGTLVSYCYRAVTNQAINILRDRRLRETRETQSMQMPAPSGDSSMSADREEFARDLWASVDRLPATLSSVLRLRFGHGLSLEETAHALALPLGTVSTRQREALAELRKRFGARMEYAAPGALAGLHAAASAEDAAFEAFLASHANPGSLSIAIPDALAYNMEAAIMAKIRTSGATMVTTCVVGILLIGCFGAYVAFADAGDNHTETAKGAAPPRGSRPGHGPASQPDPNTGTNFSKTPSAANAGQPLSSDARDLHGASAPANAHDAKPNRVPRGSNPGEPDVFVAAGPVAFVFRGTETDVLLPIHTCSLLRIEDEDSRGGAVCGHIEPRSIILDGPKILVDLALLTRSEGEVRFGEPGKYMLSIDFKGPYDPYFYTFEIADSGGVVHRIVDVKTTELDIRLTMASLRVDLPHNSGNTWEYVLWAAEDAGETYFREAQGILPRLVVPRPHGPIFPEGFFRTTAGSSPRISSRSKGLPAGQLGLDALWAGTLRVHLETSTFATLPFPDDPYAHSFECDGISQFKHSFAHVPIVTAHGTLIGEDSAAKMPDGKVELSFFRAGPDYPLATLSRANLRNMPHEWAHKRNVPPGTDGCFDVEGLVPGRYGVLCECTNELFGMGLSTQSVYEFIVTGQPTEQEVTARLLKDAQPGGR